MRAHPGKNLHAKVYIIRFPSDDRDYGRVITGSSNFSENGLVAQREFNVELKDRADVEYAFKQFENLWNEGIDIAENYINTIQQKTWLNDHITPYHIYLKLLYEYFKEDINADNEQDFRLPEGFMNLQYQKQAVVSAQKILNAYNGVFLSDVVGLGKTFITALLLQKLHTGHPLIICPPALMDYWRETLNQFYVPGCSVESLGMLNKIAKTDLRAYTYIVVDEAHHFRNELTRSYEDLHKICRNKKVILVSATPLNNRLDDIKAQIKLFQPSRNSTIPGVKNLDDFFRTQQKYLDQHNKDSPEYLNALKHASEVLRNKILKYLMVRRTRSEIKNYFSEDIHTQGLHFPHIANPQRIIYRFDLEIEHVFTRTIIHLREFSYSRYTPLLFLKKQLSMFEQQSQRNVGGFMKSILVKRLESSFYAFKKSLERFIQSYERFLKMYDSGTVWISKKVNVFDLIDEDDEDTLQELLEGGDAQKYPSENFMPIYREKLESDRDILKGIQELWEHIHTDPKAESFIYELKNNPLLSGKKALVFSESKETVDYLQNTLNEHFPGKVLSYSSAGGMYNGEGHAKEYLREIIETNYQPSHPNSRNDVFILLTTDILAEGINLHASNIIINYDLPWNPTRVLQRVGRVNRVGTEHQNIYVYNFFPTAQSEEQLGLETNIKNKIQAFHSTLGEDAKYLSDDEELASHGLFGERLYEKLNNTRSLEDDEENDDSELRYLQEIRAIRDTNAPLFTTIKGLPKKARAARHGSLSDTPHGEHRLLTFFRKGQLKKFIMCAAVDGDGDVVLADGAAAVDGAADPKELTFLEAVRLFECEPQTPGARIPHSFFALLKANKTYVKEITNEEMRTMPAGKGKGSSNEMFLIKLLKSVIGKSPEYTDDDEEYLRRVHGALERGELPRNMLKRMKQAIQQNMSPLNILGVFRNEINDNNLPNKQRAQNAGAASEVILSELIIQGDNV